MKEIDYSPYDEAESDEIPQDLIAVLEKNNIDHEEFAKVKIREVESPFILADNIFDLREANNDLYEIDVKREETVQFTGGNYYTKFAKNGENPIVIHGNGEEGYNIFILK